MAVLATSWPLMERVTVAKGTGLPAASTTVPSTGRAAPEVMPSGASGTMPVTTEASRL